MNTRIGTAALVSLLAGLLFLVPSLPVALNQCPVYSICPYPGKSYQGVVSASYYLTGTGGTLVGGRYQLSLAPRWNPLYGDPGPSVSVQSIDQGGNTMTGFYVVLYDGSGHVLSQGYTPVTFSELVAGDKYTVQPQGYGGCTFMDWFDSTSPAPYRTFIANDSTLTLYALFNGTCP